MKIHSSKHVIEIIKRFTVRCVLTCYSLHVIRNCDENNSFLIITALSENRNTHLNLNNQQLKRLIET